LQIAQEVRRGGVTTGKPYAATSLVVRMNLRPDRIALTNPAVRPFSDCMHRLPSLDRSTRALDGSEAEACGEALPDETMILFNDLY
jgi:hypothetical protein